MTNNDPIAPQPVRQCWSWAQYNLYRGGPLGQWGRRIMKYEQLMQAPWQPTLPPIHQMDGRRLRWRSNRRNRND